MAPTVSVLSLFKLFFSLGHSHVNIPELPLTCIIFSYLSIEVSGCLSFLFSSYFSLPEASIISNPGAIATVHS